MRKQLKKAGWVFAFTAVAQAAYAYDCTLNVTNVSLLYSPTATTPTVMTGSWSFTCTRIAGESATLTWDLKANSGVQPANTTNRVQLGATTNRYAYELYRVNAVVNSNRWQLQNSLRFTGTLNFGTALVASQAATTFYVIFQGPQTALAAGAYTDTVTATLGIVGSATDLATRNFTITANTQPACLLTTTPGPLNFNYTAFQTTAATSSTTFQTLCTPSLPYSLALSAPSSTLSGLTYNLVMSTNPGNVVVPSSTSGTGLAGNGALQTYNINGTVPANQAGDCATATCNATQPQTLTITY
jgi:spore coat protein U-like protein